MNVSHASAVSDINAETDEGTRETNKNSHLQSLIASARARMSSG